MGFRLELSVAERVYHAADGGFRLSVPDFTVSQGETVCVLGGSGTGKSTFLDVLAFLAPPSGCGRFLLQVDAITYDLRDAWGRRRSGHICDLRARYLGYILQTGGLIPYLSLRDNMLLSRRLLGLRGAGPVEALARDLGLWGLMDRTPRQISIGQRQRAAVVRALAHEPRLVLADEPTASLDPELAHCLIDILKDATASRGTALVLVSHDPTIVARAGGRLVHCTPVKGSHPATTIVAERPSC